MESIRIADPFERREAKGGRGMKGSGKMEGIRVSYYTEGAPKRK